MWLDLRQSQHLRRRGERVRGSGSSLVTGAQWDPASKPTKQQSSNVHLQAWDVWLTFTNACESATSAEGGLEASCGVEIPVASFWPCPSACYVSLLTNWTSGEAWPCSAAWNLSPSPNVKPLHFEKAVSTSLFTRHRSTVSGLFLEMISVISWMLYPHTLTITLVCLCVCSYPPPVPCPRAVMGTVYYCFLPSAHSFAGWLIFLFGHPFSSAWSVCPPATKQCFLGGIIFNYFLVITFFLGLYSLSW